MYISQPIPWKRLTVEATAIVVSILMAFAIDAWWDERRERDAENVVMERLRADFISIRSGLAVVEEDHVTTSNACLALLKFSPGVTLPANAEMDRLIALIFLASRTFNPGSGAVASFLSSDEGQLIRNQELADRLLAWSGVVEELQEEEASLQKGVAERWSPYLASQVHLGPYIAAIGGPMHALPNNVTDPRPRDPIIVDQVFLNHVLDRFKWQQITLRDIEPVRSTLEEILGLLDEELDR